MWKEMVHIFFVQVSEVRPFQIFCCLLEFGESLLSLLSHLLLFLFHNFVILLHSTYQTCFYRFIFLYCTIHSELLKVPTKTFFFHTLYFLLRNLVCPQRLPSPSPSLSYLEFLKSMKKPLVQN